jgi:ribonuclease-3
MPHMFVDDLEILEINHKNKLYGWANKNGKNLEFETLDERLENGRRLFTIGATVNGKVIAQGKAFNKKDASQIAAQLAVEKLGIVNSDSVGKE